MWFTDICPIRKTNPIQGINGESIFDAIRYAPAALMKIVRRPSHRSNRPTRMNKATLQGQFQADVANGKELTL
jgi:hypothetical protein